jgi:hypothetical protein
MPSRLNSPSAEGEAEVEAEVTKEEGEVQVTITQVKVTDNIKISKVNQNFQPQRGRGRRSNDKSSIQCYYCKKYGHYESECRKKQADQLSGRAHVSNHEGETSDGMFLSCHKTEEQHKDLWLLDSGCNNHMTGNKDLLSCIDSSISSDITLGNDSLVKVQGKGTVPILTKQNVKKDINNVYHVPDLKHNLLSVGQLLNMAIRYFLKEHHVGYMIKPPTEN